MNFVMWLGGFVYFVKYVCWQSFYYNSTFTIKRGRINSLNKLGNWSLRQKIWDVEDAKACVGSRTPWFVMGPWGMLVFAWSHHMIWSMFDREVILLKALSFYTKQTCLISSKKKY